MDKDTKTYVVVYTEMYLNIPLVDELIKFINSDRVRSFLGLSKPDFKNYPEIPHTLFNRFGIQEAAYRTTDECRHFVDQITRMNGIPMFTYMYGGVPSGLDIINYNRDMGISFENYKDIYFLLRFTQQGVKEFIKESIFGVLEDLSIFNYFTVESAMHGVKFSDNLCNIYYMTVSYIMDKKGEMPVIIMKDDHATVTVELNEPNFMSAIETAKNMYISFGGKDFDMLKVYKSEMSVEYKAVKI